MSTISTPSIERGKSSASVPVTIAAGGKKTLNATGTCFFVLESPCRVSIRMDTTAACLYKAGTGLETTGGAVFEWLEIENPSTSEITILLYVGFARYEDKRHTIQEGATLATAYPTGDMIPASARIVLDGIPPAGASQRKTVLISNADPAALLYLETVAGVTIATVFPQTTIAPAISGPVVLRNRSAVPIPGSIGEVWYATAG